MLIVFTDGRPSMGKECRELILKIQREIEVYGIGIGLDVSDLFSQSVMIDDSNQLSSAFDNLLMTRLAS